MTKFRWNDPPSESDPARVQRDLRRPMLSDTETARLRGLAWLRIPLGPVGKALKEALAHRRTERKAARKEAAAQREAVAREKAAGRRAARQQAAAINTAIGKPKPGKPAPMRRNLSKHSKVSPKPPLTPADIEQEELRKRIKMRQMEDGP
jgi:hypothetical protein